jgi:hypothetical protein
VAFITGKITVKNPTAEQAAYVFGSGLGPTGYVAYLLSSLASGKISKVQPDVLDLLSSPAVARSVAGTPLAKVAAELTAQIAAHKAAANEHVQTPVDEHVQTPVDEHVQTANEHVQTVFSPGAWGVFTEVARHFEGITTEMVATAYSKHGDLTVMPTINSAFDTLCTASDLDHVHRLAALRDDPAGSPVTSEFAITG